MNTKTDYAVGKKDESGKLITVVHSFGDDHVIYEDETGGISWRTTNPKLARRFNRIDPIIMKVYAIANSKRLTKMTHYGWAQALATCAVVDAKTAEKIILETEAKIIGIKNIEGRLNYLASGMIMILLFILALFITSYFQILSGAAVFYLYVLVFGGIGSFLSVAINLNKIVIDPQATPRINVIAGISRIFIGMIGAVIVYFLIRANILFGMIGQLNSDYAMLAVCALAGFSETLIPNVLKNMESQQ